LDRGDLTAIIDWMPHGRAFVVKQPKLFEAEVLPRFFKQTKYLSFTRQLNLWSYKRITRGMDAGAYYHPLFLPGKLHLTMRMKRQKIKGTGTRPIANPSAEPKFYYQYKHVALVRKTPGPLPPLRSERIANLNMGNTAPSSSVSDILQQQTMSITAQLGSFDGLVGITVPQRQLALAGLSSAASSNPAALSLAPSTISILPHSANSAILKYLATELHPKQHDESRNLTVAPPRTDRPAFAQAGAYLALQQHDNVNISAANIQLLDRLLNIPVHPSLPSLLAAPAAPALTPLTPAAFAYLDSTRRAAMLELSTLAGYHPHLQALAPPAQPLCTSLRSQPCHRSHALQEKH